MDLDEKQAKEILDFLAKRIGFLGVEATQTCPSGWWNIGCLKEDWMGNMRFCILVYDTAFGNQVMSETCSYASLLKDMLKKSKKGHCVKIFGWARLFLQPFSSLDEILVEMDLSCN